MRKVLASVVAVVGVVAAGPGRAEPMTRAQAAQLAFMAELAPHTCGDFEQNIPAVAAWMTNFGIMQEDLLRRDRYGMDIIQALSKFQGSVTWRGVKATCDDLYRDLGPTGADLVKR